MTWWITDTSIGQRLKFVRRFRRLTQKELGLLMGFPLLETENRAISDRIICVRCLQSDSRDS